MSLSRASFATLRRALANARRQASTQAEQTFRPQTVDDPSYMWKPSTWFRYYEVLPLLSCTAFAGVICAGYIGYSFFKEDVRIDNSKTIAPYEAFANEHRYKIIDMHNHSKNLLPPDVAELKKQLGPYEVHHKH